MDLKLFISVFFMILFAEFGDKTQIMALTLSAQSPKSTYTLAIAVASALALSGILGVVAGRFLSEFINPQIVKLVSGLIFIAFGVFTLSQYYSKS